MEEAVMLFDIDTTAVKKSFPRPAMEQAYTILLNMFRDFRVKSEVLPLEYVDFNLMAASGALYTKQYGKKGQALMTPAVLQEIARYDKQAHIVNAEPLWNGSGKEEIIALEKILKEIADQRIFEIPPITFLAIELMKCQSFNKQMYTHWSDWPIRVGAVLQKGGFDHIHKHSDIGGIKGMGDSKKWDKHFCDELRMFCCRLRCALFEPTEEITTEMFTTQMKWIYEKCIRTYIVMPWGEVLRILTGMKSGDGNTTPDNSIGDLMVFFAYVIDALPEIKFKDWRQIVRILYPNIYSDDHDFCTAVKYGFLAEYKRRNEFFNRCGFQLKKEDDKTGPDWTGIKFLGGTAVRYYNTWVPVYSTDRIRGGLRILEGRKDLGDIVRYYKVMSLLILSTFSGRVVFDHIRNFLLKLDHKQGRLLKPSQALDVLQYIGNFNGEENFINAIQTIPFVPTHKWCVWFWTNLESALYVTSHCERQAEKESEVTLFENTNLHGNHCGPGWSDNKYQDSVETTLEGVDDLDKTCAVHDTKYARNEDLIEADLKFAWDNLSSGEIKRALFGLGVGAQGIARILNIMPRYGRQNGSSPSTFGGRPQTKAANQNKLSNAIRNGNLHRLIQSEVTRARATRTARSMHARGGFAPGKRGRPQYNRTHIVPLRRALERKPRNRGVPAAYSGSHRGKGVIRQTSSKNSTTITGEELIGAVNVITTQQQGDNLGTYPIAPQNYDGTRLQILASLYEQYKVLHWSVEYIPSVGTGASGNIMMYIDPDVSDNPGTGLPAVQKAMTAKGIDFPIYNKAKVTYRPVKGMTDLYTSDGTDLRFSQGGNVFVLSNTTGFAAATTVGALILKYKIKFFKPLLEVAVNPSSNSGSAHITGYSAAAPFSGTMIQINNGNILISKYNQNTLFFPCQAKKPYYVMIVALYASCTGPWTTVVFNDSNTGTGPALNPATGYQLPNTTTGSAYYYNVTSGISGNVSMTVAAFTAVTSPILIRVTVVRTNALSEEPDSLTPTPSMKMLALESKLKRAEQLLDDIDRRGRKHHHQYIDKEHRNPQYKGNHFEATEEDYDGFTSEDDDGEGTDLEDCSGPEFDNDEQRVWNALKENCLLGKQDYFWFKGMKVYPEKDPKPLPHSELVRKRSKSMDEKKSRVKTTKEKVTSVTKVEEAMSATPQ